MNVEVFREYCIAKKGVTEDFPFDEHTLVFKVMGKMFALCGLERVPSQVNLKCDPERAVQLREEYDGGVIAGWHMSKVHWNTVILESVPPKLVAELIDHSYDLVISKFTKKLKAELDELQ
ncbi:MmcQ/YjbR family DNA-binding protein [Costertonia aggregata]|uniref:MmcQ/YjbR family DNA-binding protein n=1 Tax=Costertonia aggregata TaxID=343403 RepID=A0A7H9AML0_9FLAO|nr:MmcQ/YjbR family DNA-binding protein [Costertonia aggregata]QLG44657.1 MmcQ/YjbR family DNA-binding protein [Costertonia aggregata]